MNKALRRLAGVAAITLVAWPVSAQTDLETKLRDALRAATAQVRSLEDERATLLAKQSQLESELKSLKEQGSPNAANQAVAAQYERIFAEREQAYKTAVDEFNVRLQEERDQALRIQEAAQKWKAAYNEATAALKAKEGERQSLAVQVAASSEQIERCQTQNQDLFKLSSEILERYRNVGVGDVITAREPFLGLKRVELENQMQDYDDRLLDNRFDTAAAPSPSPQQEPRSEAAQ